MTDRVTVLDSYRDENLDKTFANDVLDALRQIPAGWRQSCAAHVTSLTDRTEWKDTRHGLMLVTVPTGVDQRRAWAETVAAFESGWRPPRVESPANLAPESEPDRS